MSLYKLHEKDKHKAEETTSLLDDDMNATTRSKVEEDVHIKTITDNIDIPRSTIWSRHRHTIA
jgi:hypothetical protein